MERGRWNVVSAGVEAYDAQNRDPKSEILEKVLGLGRGGYDSRL